MLELIKKTAKLIVRLILGLLSMFGILLCLFLVFWLLIIPIGNEVILKGYIKEVINYDTGSDYEVLETAGACGKLFSNGNGMQYLAVALIKSETELAASGDLTGYYIFESMQNAPQDSIWNWDMRAH